MTTPRIVSLTALAASLLIVIFTMTQASGLTITPGSSLICPDAIVAAECGLADTTLQAGLN